MMDIKVFIGSNESVRWDEVIPKVGFWSRPTKAVLIEAALILNQEVA